MNIQQLAIGILACSAMAAFAQIDRLLGGPVASGNFSSRYTLVSSNSDNMRVVLDPTGSGRSVLELQVRDTDADVYGGLRTELSTNRDYTREGVRWYAMSVYLPGSWQFHAYPTVVAQLHTSQKRTILSPPVSFVVRGRNLDLELYANHRSIDGPDPAKRANSAHQLIRLDRLKTQQWYCFVVKADWSRYTGQGSLRIWMNGDRVYDAANLSNSYETWLGNYARVGVYMPGKRSITNRVIYADYIHLGGPRTGLIEMTSQTPCGPPTEQEGS
jgi:hypothetical protein